MRVSQLKSTLKLFIKKHKTKLKMPSNPNTMKAACVIMS